MKTPSDDCYQRGIECGQAGDFHRAKVEFEKALKIDRFDYSARLSLGMADDAISGRISKTTALHMFRSVPLSGEQKIAELKVALELSPDYAPVYRELASAYGEMNKIDDEIAFLERSIALEPGSATAHNNLGWAYHKRKHDFARAITNYNKAIELDPTYVTAHHNIGVAYSEKEMVDEAIAHLTKATRIDPSLAAAHYDLALEYYEKGAYRSAAIHADKAVKLGAPADPEFLRMVKPYRRMHALVREQLMPLLRLPFLIVGLVVLGRFAAQPLTFTRYLIGSFLVGTLVWRGLRRIEGPILTPLQREHISRNIHLPWHEKDAIGSRDDLRRMVKGSAFWMVGSFAVWLVVGTTLFTGDVQLQTYFPRWMTVVTSCGGAYALAVCLTNIEKMLSRRS